MLLLAPLSHAGSSALGRLPFSSPAPSAASRSSPSASSCRPRPLASSPRPRGIPSVVPDPRTRPGAFGCPELLFQRSLSCRFTNFNNTPHAYVAWLQRAPHAGESVALKHPSPVPRKLHLGLGSLLSSGQPDFASASVPTTSASRSRAPPRPTLSAPTSATSQRNSRGPIGLVWPPSPASQLPSASTCSPLALYGLQLPIATRLRLGLGPNRIGLGLLPSASYGLQFPRSPSSDSLNPCFGCVAEKQSRAHRPHTAFVSNKPASLGLGLLSLGLVQPPAPNRCPTPPQPRSQLCRPRLAPRS